MTQTELKNFFRATLLAQRTIAQEFLALDAIVDFITQSITTGIPDWTNALTFNQDGSGAGAFCTEPDTNGNIRFWKTKTDGNINNQPPTNPLTTENTNWIEVSPGDGSAIKEWQAGPYGTGLIIVYHNHSVDGPGLYLLLDPVRPFNSTNIETEITAGDWARMPAKEIAHATAAGTDTYTATLAPAITAYATNQKVYIKFTNANTGAATINLNGLGAKAIKKSGTAALVAGDISAGQILCLVYDGTNFQVVGGGGGSGVSLTDPLVFKGVVDCSANPNYPAADAGDLYKVSVAGKIGGGSGPNVEVGDTLLCITDATASGTHAGVGANWVILQTNIDPALYALLASPTFTGTPAAPTAAPGTNTTQLATTAFVIAEKLVASFLNWLFGIVPEAATTHTFVLTDSGKIIRSSNAGTSTFTIPANATIAYPTGSWIEFERTNGVVVLAPAAGVTFITEDASNLTIRKQYGKIRATKVATDTWHIAHSPASWWEFAKTQTATVTAQWIFQGVDDSSATVGFIIRNLSGDIIFQTYNDQQVEIGGTEFIIDIGTTIASGNARIVMNDNQAMGLIIEGRDGKEYISFRTTDSDERFNIRVKRRLDTLSGEAPMDEFQFSNTANATNSSVTLIGSIPMDASEEVVFFEVEFMCIASTGAGGFQKIKGAIQRTSAGTVADFGGQVSDTIQRTAGTFLFSVDEDDTNKRINLNFTQNTSGGLAYKLIANAKWTRTLEPA